jgi:hypothetical protein
MRKTARNMGHSSNDDEAEAMFGERFSGGAEIKKACQKI